jgi:heme a synthase
VIKLFRRFGLLTIASVILLILVGGFVRATGSGMGCPDWPKCFGQWIPPTHIGELPPNYQEVYGAKLKGEVIFNPTKTWIEYINRLIGVLVGFFILLTAFFAYRVYFKTNYKSIFWYSFFAFLLVVFEGWLGSKVVSSELHPLLVTIHMLVSLVILAFLVFAILKTYFVEGKLPIINASREKSFLMVLGIAFMIGQICFGTQLREGIDAAQKILGDESRATWVDSIFGKMLFHGGLSLVILAISVFAMKVFSNENTKIKNLLKSLVALVCFSIISGGILGFAGFPAFAQPIHLVVSVLIITLMFVIIFLLNPEII